MIPVITINGQQLTLSQIRLFRKLILDYIGGLSNFVWEYIEKNDPNMASLPAQRTRCFELLEFIDGMRTITPCYPGPFGTDVTINGYQLQGAYCEMTRMVFSCNPYSPLSQEEMVDAQIVVNAVMLKT